MSAIMNAPLTHAVNNTNIKSTGLSSVEERALKLLGNNLGPEVVAQATGVSVSRISQLLSDPSFSSKVMDLRCNALQKHNDRDEQYDAIEDTLITKLKDLIPFMYKPGEVLGAIRIINGATRRGIKAAVHEGTNTTVVNITLPSIITQKFVTDINNQVISAGEQELITVQSSSMSRLTIEQNMKSISSTQNNTVINTQDVGESGDETFK